MLAGEGSSSQRTLLYIYVSSYFYMCPRTAIGACGRGAPAVLRVRTRMTSPHTSVCVLILLQVLADEGLQKWIDKNRKWLEPYAAFKVQNP